MSEPNGIETGMHPQVTVSAIPQSDGHHQIVIQSNIQDDERAWLTIRNILLAALQQAVVQDDKRRMGTEEIESLPEKNRIIRPQLRPLKRNMV